MAECSYDAVQTCAAFTSHLLLPCAGLATSRRFSTLTLEHATKAQNSIRATQVSATERSPPSSHVQGMDLSDAPIIATLAFTQVIAQDSQRWAAGMPMRLSQGHLLLTKEMQARSDIQVCAEWSPKSRFYAGRCSFESVCWTSRWCKEGHGSLARRDCCLGVQHGCLGRTDSSHSIWTVHDRLEICRRKASNLTGMHTGNLGVCKAVYACPFKEDSTTIFPTAAYGPSCNILLSSGLSGSRAGPFECADRVLIDLA